MIFQDPFSSLNPRMTVADSILEPMEIHHMYDGDKDRQREEVARIMDTVGLARRLADSYPHELDGGRRQRVGIARALALQPDFIVCDEPVSALDVSIQAQILNLMQDLQEQSGLTYIFITHDLSVVKHISDEICVMYLGNLVEKCPSDKLFEKQLHPYSQALLSAIPVAKTDAVRNRIRVKFLPRSILPPAAALLPDACMQSRNASRHSRNSKRWSPSTSWPATCLTDQLPLVRRASALRNKKQRKADLQ